MGGATPLIHYVAREIVDLAHCRAGVGLDCNITVTASNISIWVYSSLTTCVTSDRALGCHAHRVNSRLRKG